jgi:O-acetyl-ADP-ribose deacetylase (regulator of RNase III)
VDFAGRVLGGLTTMSITFVTGNLFTTPHLDALAHGVNGAGRMGLGIAVKFRRLWPKIFEEYERRCRRRELHPGDLFAWQADKRWIYNLVTQDRPGPRATLPAIQVSLQRMVAHARAAGVRRIGLPQIGCGLGGLDWDDVRPVVEGAASLAGEVELVVVSLPGEEP